MNTAANNFAKAEMMIRRPVHDVFEAFIDPGITTKFWFSKSTGKLEEGEITEWTWEMYRLTIPVLTKKIDPNKNIFIEWGEGENLSSVEWTFTALSKDKTFVRVINSGLKAIGDELFSAIRDSTEGFTLLLAGAKAWLEHQIQLNLVADKHPNGPE